MRHRRVGSGTLASPKSSPSRDRRYQSEPESRNVKLVDTETQTDAMDISETDGGPSPFLAQREMMSLHLTTTQHQPPQPQLIQQQQQQQQSRIHPIPHPEHQSIREEMHSSQDNQSNPSPTSPNGNTMSTSDITYHDACSSPDLIDDAMNSNERLEIRECSDDDHLETLGRKVNDFLTENRLSIRSNKSENGNVANTDTDLIYSVSSTTRKGHQGGGGGGGCTDKSEITINRCAAAVKDINNCESVEDFEDSWTDEEGEDTDYNYSLRRKR